MKRIALVPLMLLVIPTAASAGEIFGKIQTAGAPAAEGTTVTAKCGEKAYPAVSTDKSGSYHLVVAEPGKCTLTITMKGQSASLQVLSYDAGSQADIVLEVKDGKLTARRK